MPKLTLVMFPGQGSQYVGMGKVLFDQFPSTRLIFEEAEDAIAFNIRKLCFDGTETDLMLTKNTQPCILTVSIACWQVLVNERGFKPDLFAGHSLGEYSALVAAQKLAFATAVKLVRNRGQFMQEAVPEGMGAMAAILNFDGEKLKTLCKRYSSEKGVVQIANYNSPVQQVIAGHKTAVQSLCQELEQQKIRFMLLPVSAPFHSVLMKPAKEKMSPLLKGTKLNDNDHQVIANVSAKIEANYNIDLLIEQIDSPVLWTQSMEAAEHHGCEMFVEVGPGRVLFGLARRIVSKEAKLIHSDDMKQTLQQL